jgi:hypothetical protein
MTYGRPEVKDRTGWHAVIKRHALSTQPAAKSLKDFNAMELNTEFKGLGYNYLPALRVAGLIAITGNNVDGQSPIRSTIV